jgi:hypothetical protein
MLLRGGKERNIVQMGIAIEAVSFVSEVLRV